MHKDFILKSFDDMPLHLRLALRIVDHFFNLGLCENEGALSFGDTIYADDHLVPSIVSHEETHLRQHRYSIFFAYLYLIRYAFSKKFRLKSEIEATKAEWETVQVHIFDRNQQNILLNIMASNLCHPGYGGIVESQQEAIKLITQ